MGKVGTSGRFGPRYGKKVREKVAEIEKRQKGRHVCPKCSLPYVRRLSKGIYLCSKCSNKFAGQAYFPRSG